MDNHGDNMSSVEIDDSIIDRYFENGEKRGELYKILEDVQGRYSKETRRGREQAFLSRLNNFINSYMKGSQPDLTRILRELVNFESKLEHVKEQKLADKLSILIVYVWARAMFEPLINRLYKDQAEFKLWNSNILQKGSRFQGTKWVRDFSSYTGKWLKNRISLKVASNIARELNKCTNPHDLAAKIEEMEKRWLKAIIIFQHQVVKQRNTLEKKRRTLLKKLEESMQREVDLNKATLVLSSAAAEETTRLSQIDKQIIELSKWLEKTLNALSSIGKQWVSGDRPYKREDIDMFEQYYGLLLKYMEQQKNLLDQNHERKKEIQELTENVIDLFAGIKEQVREDKSVSAINLPKAA